MRGVEFGCYQTEAARYSLLFNPPGWWIIGARVIVRHHLSDRRAGVAHCPAPFSFLFASPETFVYHAPHPGGR